MKSSEEYFKFPIRIYDDFSLTKAFFKETKKLESADDPNDIDEPEKGEWAGGYARVNPRDILGWIDHFEEGTPVKNVATDGFEMTLVYVKRLGKFECVWKREKFETMLDAHLKKLT